MPKAHEHRWHVMNVGYFVIASDIPEYFAIRIICLDCAEGRVNATEASEN